MSDQSTYASLMAMFEPRREPVPYEAKHSIRVDITDETVHLYLNQFTPLFAHPPSTITVTFDQDQAARIGREIFKALDALGWEGERPAGWIQAD